MEKQEGCVLCGQPAVRAPRMVVRQEYEHDLATTHVLPLCAAHGAELRAGRSTPQQIIYTWASRAHRELYRGERVVLLPELLCLECNAPLPEDRADGDAPEATRDVSCTECGAVNTLGSALGHRVAVSVRALMTP
jgi:hypothetical protein